MSILDPIESLSDQAGIGAQWPRLSRASLRRSSLRVLTLTASAALDSWGEDPVTDSSKAELVWIDATAGDVAVTLPPIADNLGRRIIFKRKDPSMNDAEIEPDGSEEIEGASVAQALASQYDTLDLFADADGWWIL